MRNSCLCQAANESVPVDVRVPIRVHLCDKLMKRIVETRED